MLGALQEVLEALPPLAKICSTGGRLIRRFVPLQTDMSRDPVEVPLQGACSNHGLDGGNYRLM